MLSLEQTSKQTFVPCDCLCIVLKHLLHSLAVHILPKPVDFFPVFPFRCFFSFFSSSSSSAAAGRSCCRRCDYFAASPRFGPWSGDQGRGDERFDAKRQSIQVVVAVVGDADERFDKLSKENLGRRVAARP